MSFRRSVIVLVLPLLIGGGRLLGQASGIARLAAAESAYAAVRTLKDRIDILGFRGPSPALADSINRLSPAYRASRRVLERLVAIDSLALADSIDRRALATMQRALANELPIQIRHSPDAEIPAAECRYNPDSLLHTGGEQALASRLYACFGLAAGNLEVGSEHLTRLSLLGRLGAESDPAKRRALFLALRPTWDAVNGVDVSPYRILLARRAGQWRPGARPYELAGRQTGIPADTVIAWLESVLERWRQATSDQPVEPWDLYYIMGEAGRTLERQVPRDSLLPLTRRFYRDLGADPDALGIHYDIFPRPGKGPVAFTTIGRRAANGVRPESWVFATYPEGGFDNLEELLHETGHGIHLAGLATRPAFTDWPRSDIFTEAIADVAALEVYEPAWQQKYLGDSTSLTLSLRGKYFGIMMDMAWALFEIRLEQQPEADPNQVWTGLMSRYFHVVPHPELSWWAMRGQLIEETGYMLNYALGAIMVADLRATIARRHGPFTTGDSTFYPYLQQQIYRFGRERSAQQVVSDFLGREPRPGALLDDLARIERP